MKGLEDLCWRWDLELVGLAKMLLSSDVVCRVGRGGGSDEGGDLNGRMCDRILGMSVFGFVCL